MSEPVVDKKVSKFNSRKWYGFIAILICSLIAMYSSKITGEQWSDFMLWVYIIYAGGNVAEKVGVKFNK